MFSGEYALRALSIRYPDSAPSQKPRDASVSRFPRFIASESRSFISSYRIHKTSRVLWLPLAFLFAGGKQKYAPRLRFPHAVCAGTLLISTNMQKTQNACSG